MKAKGINHIGWSESKKGSKAFTSVNPVTGENTSIVFHEATKEEVNSALELARAAFPEFQQLDLKKRVGFIHSIADGLEKNQQVLVDSFCLESGLPEARAITELKRTCYQLRSYSNGVLSGFTLQAIIDTGDKNRLPVPKPDLRKINTGIGPVVVFGASNFPFAYSTAGGDTASALAAGCPVIVKGHPMHPQTSELVASIVIQTAKDHKMPEGVFSHLHAVGFEVAEQLVKDPRVKGVGFTGSTTGGMALYKLAAEREEPIPVFAEMGSVNPVIAFPSAVSENKELATTIASSVKLNAGQFCTSPGLFIYVSSEETPSFEKELQSLFLEAEPQVMLSPGMYSGYEKAKAAQLQGTDKLAFEETTDLNSIQPVLARISGKEFIENIHRQDEVFGSFLMLVSCASSEELKQAAAVIRGQLTASVFFGINETDEVKELTAVLHRKVGRIIYNGVPTGVEVSPAMQHGGTFPAVTDSRFTSVGDSAVLRWMRPVTFQNCPDELLPETLKNDNPLGILRFINDKYVTDRC